MQLTPRAGSTDENTSKNQSNQMRQSGDSYCNQIQNCKRFQLLENYPDCILIPNEIQYKQFSMFVVKNGQKLVATNKIVRLCNWQTATSNILQFFGAVIGCKMKGGPTSASRHHKHFGSCAKIHGNSIRFGTMGLTQIWSPQSDAIRGYKSSWTWNFSQSLSVPKVNAQKLVAQTEICQTLLPKKSAAASSAAETSAS